MSKQIAIVCYKGRMIAATLDDDELCELRVVNPKRQSKIGNIYLGRVKNVVKNIHSTFIEIDKNEMCYLSLKEADSTALCAKRTKEGTFVQGDEVLVQVVKDGVKSKVPSVTTRITLTGKYLVLTYGATQISVSKKISDEQQRIRLKSLVSSSEEYGWIVRTNAALVSDEEITKEAEKLSRSYQEMKERMGHLIAPYQLRQESDEIKRYIRDQISHPEIELIRTDQKDMYEDLCKDELISKTELGKLQMYTDDSYPLIKLLGLEKKLVNALNKKVWLKSGGSIVIEPTEALTSIDVNTEKAVHGNRNPETTFLKINKEAAVEIARQLRVRNLSGIIIIDFIDLKSAENRRELLSFLKSLIAKDSVKTMLVDMTPLGLVELTRMKRYRPLHEEFRREQSDE